MDSILLVLLHADSLEDPPSLSHVLLLIYDDDDDDNSVRLCRHVTVTVVE